MSTTSKKTNIKKEKIKKGVKQSLFILLHSLKWLVLAGVLFGLLAFGVVFGYVTALVKDEPVRPKADIIAAIAQNSETGFVYFAASGESGIAPEMGQLRSEVDRQPITSLEKEVPQIVIDAFLAIEDNKFMTHYGIDFAGTLRAVKQKFLNEDVQTGGSTITQQLARNVFLSRVVTDSRKFKEIFLAMRMERFLSKEEILVGYLNKVPFGKSSTGYNVLGIKAASEGIFNKELKDLNVAQAAYLAGLPQSPTSFSAYTSSGEFDLKGFQSAVSRQKLVLKRMFEEKKITQEEYDQALSFDLQASLAPASKKAYNRYPFLMLEVERRVAIQLVLKEHPELTEADLKGDKYSEMLMEAHDEVLNGGYKIYTTVDKDIYEALQEIAANEENFTPNHEEKGVEQVGGMLINNKTGAILGMIEGRDFHIEQLNHATQMVRQPGSTMKTVAAYLPAIESGKIQPATIVDDSPYILPDGSKGFHIPNNFNLKFNGLMTARRALDQSYNVPALKIFNDVVTIPEAWSFAKKLGITTLTEDDNNHRTGVIGGLDYGVTIEELTNAYSAMGNNGEFNDAYLIEKITTIDGQVVYEHKHNPVRVFSEESAYIVSDMLRTVIQNGSGASIKSSFKHWDQTIVVGKTGTTQNEHDVWFMGYSPDISGGTWIGYDQQASLEASGRQRAMQIWSLMMNAAVEHRPDLFEHKSFEKPENIVTMTVSGASGKLPNELASETGRLTTDIFNKKYIPIEEDNSLVKMDLIKFEGLNYIPQPETPADFIQNKVVIKRDPSIYSTITRIKELYETSPKSSLPTDSRGNARPISYFLPIDADLDAPSVVDPRVDDGQIPATPGNANLVRNEQTGEVTITFAKSGNPDIIGYRLYRSMNGNKYVVSQILYAGDTTEFKDKIMYPDSATYYITAVDVVGKESPATAIMKSHTKSVDPGVLPPQTDEPEGGGNGNHDGDEEGDNGGSFLIPAKPLNVSIEPNDSGSGIIMKWNANPVSDLVTEYEIYYSSRMQGPYKRIQTISDTSFEYLTDLTKGWYRVVAVNIFGSSEPSTAVQSD